MPRKIAWQRGGKWGGGRGGEKLGPGERTRMANPSLGGPNASVAASHAIPSHTIPSCISTLPRIGLDFPPPPFPRRPACGALPFLANLVQWQQKQSGSAFHKI